MKKIILFTLIASVTTFSFGQGQIGNSDMEAWANNDEPDNWNSFLTGSGTFSAFAGDQCDASTDVRPGSAGTKSCRIWSVSILGTLANGNVTLGRINMGATSPADPANYNYSVTAGTDFSEALTDTPDSIVFWVKTNAGLNGNARMKSTLHDTYDYRDPEDAAAATHVVATAVLNFAPQANWVRMAVPFVYSGPACGNTHILVTFTTNEIAGGGSANDEVFIDDVELIYNASSTIDTDGDGITNANEGTDVTNACDPCSFNLANATVAPNALWNAADCDNDGVTNGDEVIAGSDPLVSINELTKDGITVSMNNQENRINITSNSIIEGQYVIFNTLGQSVQSGNLSNQISFNQIAGIYFIHFVSNEKSYNFQFLKN